MGEEPGQDRDLGATAPQVSISVQGEDAMTGAVKAGAAMLDLLDALTEEMAPGTDLRWRVAGMGWRCDGCGKQVGADRPADWTRRGSDDLCDTCSHHDDCEAVVSEEGS